MKRWVCGKTRKAFSFLPTLSAHSNWCEISSLVTRVLSLAPENVKEKNLLTRSRGRNLVPVPYVYVLLGLHPRYEKSRLKGDLFEFKNFRVEVKELNNTLPNTPSQQIRARENNIHLV